jgi:hypothetical protein
MRNLVFASTCFLSIALTSCQQIPPAFAQKRGLKQQALQSQE